MILSLGRPGVIEEIELDTAHFKGNYPDRFSLEVCHLGEVGSYSLEELEKADWKPLLSEQKLQADHQHHFDGEIVEQHHATHVRLNIFPDGGVSRLRLWGKVK